jgi:hypothetical protein
VKSYCNSMLTVSGNMVHTKDKKNAYSFRGETRKINVHLEDPSLHVIVILTFILMDQDWRMRIVLIWIKSGIGDGL